MTRWHVVVSSSNAGQQSLISEPRLWLERRAIGSRVGGFSSAPSRLRRSWRAQIQSAQELGVYGYDESRHAHRQCTYTHGSIDSPPDQKTRRGLGVAYDRGVGVDRSEYEAM